jgi:DNA-binding HxlR family transcriptional regulator
VSSNTYRRAVAGSSRALAEHGAAAIATSIILALSNNARKSFSQLLAEIGAPSQSVLASELVQICSDGWCFRNPHNGLYGLTSRGADMLDASRRQRGRSQARRAA